MPMYVPDPPYMANAVATLFFIAIMIVGIYTFINSLDKGYSYYHKIMLPSSNKEAINQYIEPLDNNSEAKEKFPIILQRAEIDLSIITSIHNQGELAVILIEKIENFFSTFCAENGNKTFELIVVANGSDDNTMKIIKEFAHNYDNIFILKLEKTIPQGTAIATGVLHSRGKRIFHFLPFLGLNITDFHQMDEMMNDITKTTSKGLIVGLWKFDEDTETYVSTTLGKFISKATKKLFESFNVEGTALSRSHSFYVTRDAAINIYPNLYTYGHTVEVEILYLAGLSRTKIRSYENTLLFKSNLRMESVDRLFELMMAFYIFVLYKSGIHKPRHFSYQ